MHKPTLTYTMRSDIDPGAGTLQIKIDGTEIASYSGSTPSLDLYWSDLSDFSGSTVELEIEFQADYGEGFATAWLDDVSLGSYQVLRIDLLDPSIILNGWQGQVLTVTGDNFIDPVTVMLDGILLSGVTYVNETSLLIELPADFPPGIYDLRIINPQGHEAVLVNALSLGQHFYMPAINGP